MNHCSASTQNIVLAVLVIAVHRSEDWRTAHTPVHQCWMRAVSEHGIEIGLRLQAARMLIDARHKLQSKLETKDQVTRECRRLGMTHSKYALRRGRACT